MISAAVDDQESKLNKGDLLYPEVSLQSMLLDSGHLN